MSRRIFVHLPQHFLITCPTGQFPDITENSKQRVMVFLDENRIGVYGFIKKGTNVLEIHVDDNEIENHFYISITRGGQCIGHLTYAGDGVVELNNNWSIDAQTVQNWAVNKGALM